MATSPAQPKTHSNEDSSSNESGAPRFERDIRRHMRHTVDRDSEMESHSESHSTNDEDSIKDVVKKVEALGKKRSNSETMNRGLGIGKTGNFLRENPLLPGQYWGYVKNSPPPATLATNTELPPASRTSVAANRASTAFTPRGIADPKTLNEYRQLRVVSPPREKVEVKPVKGILRRPREKFPEDPLPIREGVAPLAKAREDRIPPDARWTKISRKLVNPEALELGKERYAVGEDFVIILRVLSKEEVQGYAEVTRSIRANREEAEAVEEAKEVEEVEELKAVKRTRYSTSQKRKRHEDQSGESRRSSWLRDTDSDPAYANEQAPNLSDTQRILEEDGGTASDYGLSPELIEATTAKVKQEVMIHLEGNGHVVSKSGEPAIEKLVKKKTKEQLNPTMIKLDEHDTHERSGDDLSGHDSPSIADSISYIAFDFSSTVGKGQTPRGEDPLLQDRDGESTEMGDNAPLGLDEQGDSPNRLPREIEQIQPRSSSNKPPEIESYEEDNGSVTSLHSHAPSLASITDSLFSLVSGSSMSSLTRPQEAVDRLVSLLLDDKEINSLCTSALTTIAPDRFERNLRRLLKEFSAGLRKEAETPQQRRASQFVHLRARNSAYMICNSITKERTRRQNDIEFEYVLSEESDSERSDDEVDDLQQLEAFIIASKAIDMLRENLRAFVYPHETTAATLMYKQKEGDSRDTTGTENLEVDTEEGMPHEAHLAIRPDLESKHNQDQPLSPAPVDFTVSEMEHNFETLGDIDTHLGRARIFRGPNRNIGGWIVRTILSAIIRRSSSVADGKMRMTWKCKCGHTLTDDFVELLPGAVLQLERKLNHTTDSFNTSQSSTSSGIAQTLSSGLQALLNILNLKTKTSETVLPLHDTTGSIADHTSSETSSPLPEPVYLLICYSEGRFATKLLQLDLTALHAESDRALFQILRSQYHNLTGSRLSWLSLKTLESIKFVYFEMFKSELVDVRKEDDVPPPEDVEYRYIPAPPELIPPVGSNYLMHIFQHPDCAEEEPICLSKFPKKLKEKLKCVRGVRPGWGLQFIEGWDSKKIWIILFVFFGIGSLAMGVLWAVFEHSIQDAFSMAAYMVAFATVSVGTVQAILVM